MNVEAAVSAVVSAIYRACIIYSPFSYFGSVALNVVPSGIGTPSSSVEKNYPLTTSASITSFLEPIETSKGFLN